MDDISEKLNQILNDPSSMAQFKEMANNLLGGLQPEKPEKTEKPETADGFDAAKIMSVLARLKNSSNSENEKLLMALRPHLSQGRQKKVDTAVKILKLLEIAPLIGESGFFDF